ncbi:putative membrane protein [Enterobacter hormaechei]|nr:hypothetical protein H217_4877 [Klebsiella pneumoniae DMC0799]RCG90693.1 putative membrane protein [Enterobacter hormaechei]
MNGAGELANTKMIADIFGQLITFYYFCYHFLFGRSLPD